MKKNTHDDMKDPMDNKYMLMTSFRSGVGQEVIPDLYCCTNQIVNLCFIGNPSKPKDGVLIDTGMPESAKGIVEVAEEGLVERSKSKAIILTHGQFDHLRAEFT